MKVPLQLDSAAEREDHMQRIVGKLTAGAYAVLETYVCSDFWQQFSPHILERRQGVVVAHRAGTG